MTNKLRHLRTSTPEKVPTQDQMELGQFAINSADGKVFIKKTDGTIKDITDNIFRNDTSIVISDTVDGSFNNLDTGEISVTIDGQENARIVKDQIELKEKVLIENEKELRFYENSSNGLDYVSFKSPADILDTYSLTWPAAAATKPGQLLGVNNNQLFWYDSDSFGGNRIYVSADKGDDNNDGINEPVKTIKKALQIASSKVYDNLGIPNGTRWNISVSSGDYYENNPIIVPDNVSVTGDSLRSCILRPLNSNQDMLRVRNGCYFTEFTFRDALTGAPSNPSLSGSPVYTWNYAVAFDDPLDGTVDRSGYTDLPITKPLITTSPYIQNCSIISFLGGNGCLVDGSKVITPNTPLNQIEVENPVSGPSPEQGKSMVANAFTMLSFGGTGWRVINDAYVQIVSCFQIFMLNGTYTQSGGYCSVTNSATNFGLYALRSSGYSPNAFSFDKGYVATTGANNNKQTITAFGFTRPNGPINEFIVKIYNPTTNEDITDTDFKIPLPGSSQKTFDANLDVSVGNPGIFTITSHGYSNVDKVTYFTNGGTTVEGLVNGDSYYVNVLTNNTFSLAYDDSFTRFVIVTDLGVGTHTFRKNDFEMIVGEVLETHNTFQRLTLTPGAYAFSPGDFLAGQDTQFPGNPHSAYVFSYNSGTYELDVLVNKVLVDNTEQRVLFNPTSNITSINNIVLGSPISLTAAVTKTDLWSATFEVDTTAIGGSFTNIANMTGKKIWFHRPSITNSSAHTWEYAGSGTDYNALPQNGGRGDEKYEQFSENGGQVYTSGTNELGDFKVGDFIKAFNRTGNVIFNNKVTIDSLDVLKLALSDIEINSISIDADLGENEVGGPSDSRISTQKAVWSYANNRLGAFIDKSVSTNAIPGNIIQLNANGQINRDLIPSQRSFSNFNTLGYGSRITLFDDIPVNESINGDICTEKYEELILTLDNPVTIEEGWYIIQATTNAIGYVTQSLTSTTELTVASVYGTFEILFNTTNSLTINNDSTPGDGNTTVIPTNVTSAVSSTRNYLMTASLSNQYLVISNSATTTYTNVDISNSIRYNNNLYVTTSTAHNLNNNNKLIVENETINQIGYATVISNTEFRIVNNNVDTPSTGSTTATATINAVTNSISTTGSVADASLSGTISVNDWVFGGGLPLGSKITAVNLSGDPNTFTVTFPELASVSATNTATLTFIAPLAQTGKVKSVITAADNLASGIFNEIRTGVLTSLDNLTYSKGLGYNAAGLYLRVPLTNISSSGSNATANITVSNGEISSVDIFRGGTGYQQGDILSVNSVNVGGSGSGFQITVTAVEKRIYLDMIGGILFVADDTAPDYVEQNNSLNSTITATNSVIKTFNAADQSSGGDVDYVADIINIVNHGFINGDPVEYFSSPNIAMGGLISQNIYYTKVIDSDNIELYENYNLTNKVNFGTSSTGIHNLTKYAVNLTNNSFFVNNHGFSTGDAVRITGNDLPSYLREVITTQISDNSYFFVGSVTTNSFTLHELRSEALLSVNGLVSVPLNLNAKGTGSIKFIKNEIAVVDAVNSSSKLLDNWNVLAAGNIDASNIISGVINTSRLAFGNANSESFLRGDSSWVPAVQSIEYTDNDANTAINTAGIVSISGTSNGISGTGSDSAGFITLQIQRATEQPGQNYSTIGVASFKKSHFVVGDIGDETLSPGMVYIKSAAQGGDVDSLTVNGYTDSQLRNSALHTTQPVDKGGTNITSYSIGDILYASTSTVLSKLPIDISNTVLTSTGSGPAWSPNLFLGKNLFLGGTELNSGNTSSAKLFNTNVIDLNIGGDATSLNIGSSDNQTLTSNISTYTTFGVSNNVVTANITSLTTSTTNGTTDTNKNEINLNTIAGLKVGQVVSGSTSIPAGTLITGIGSNRIYLNSSTTDIISNNTTLTFTDTNTSLGLKLGNQITITGETSNLNGTWPLTSAGSTSSTFSFKINSPVTLSDAARAGTIVKLSNLLIRNRNVTIGSSEASSSPVSAVIKAENGIGTNISGASLTLRAGLSTGVGSGGVINFQTGTNLIGGPTPLHSPITRMTIAQSTSTALDLTTAMSTANVFNTIASTVNFIGAGTLNTIASTTGNTTIRNSLVLSGPSGLTLTSVSITSTSGAFSCTATILKVGDQITVTGTSSGTGSISGYTSGTVYWITVTNGSNTFTLSASPGGAAITTPDVGTTIGLTFTLNSPALFVNNSRGISTTQTSFNLINEYATTVNAFGKATSIDIGATTGTTHIKNNLSVDADVEIKGGDLTTNQSSFNLLNTNAETINAFGNATNIQIGNSAGTTEINNNLNVVGTTKLTNLSLDDVAIRDTATLTTTSQTQTLLFNFELANYGSGKMLVQATQGTDRQITQMLVVHNGTTAYATEYGTIFTNGRLFTIDVSINGVNVEILVTSTSDLSTAYKADYTLIAI